MEEKTIRKNKFDIKIIFRFAPLAGLVFLVIFFVLTSNGRFLSAANIKILFNQLIVTALISIGGIFAFTAGCLDMSMGGCVCIAAIVSAIVGQASGSLVLMLVVAVASGLVLGLLKSFLTKVMDVPVFMITIVMGMALSALGETLMGKNVNISVSNLVGKEQNTVLYIVILAVFYIIAVILFNYSTVGKSAKIVGGNPRAADQTGINAGKTRLYAFLLGGIGVALTAIIVLMRTKSVSASTASTVGMDMMVAIVLGGMPLAGGAKSRISAALIGAAIVTALNNGLMVIGVDSGIIQLVRGILFMIVVFITGFSYRTNLLPR